MNLLAVFAKHWQAGQVKTRLVADPQQASELYLAFLKCTLARFAGVGDQRWLVYTPAAARGAFEALAGSGWRLVEQADGDLGQRMAAFFGAAFASGAQRAVLIGSDSPTLPSAHIERAFQLLERVRVVLGPANDGGYYLIGARGNVPPVFDGIEWSTARVFEQTLCRLQATGIEHTSLPPWYDVDTPPDLAQLREELGRANSEWEMALRTAVEDAMRASVAARRERRG